MKYKKLYEQNLDELSSIRYDLSFKEDKIKGLEKKVNNLEAILSRYEGRESDVRRENEWLKTTIRLMVVDADKIAGLAKELERNELALNYKI